MRNSVVLNANIVIPANQESVERQAYIDVPKDMLLFSAFPHAHYRGASSQFFMIDPSGKKTLLVSLPHYDFNWQREYNFVQPVKVPAGSKLLAVYTYDNSVRNPANPDHNRVVPWGDQSFDEMLYTAFHFEWVGETSDKMDQYSAYDKALNENRVFGMLDTKMNGKLDMSEMTGPIGKQFAEPSPRSTRIMTASLSRMSWRQPRPMRKSVGSRPRSRRASPRRARLLRPHRKSPEAEAASSTLVAARVVYL